MVPNEWANHSIEDNISFSGGSQPPREFFIDEPREGYVRLIQIRDYKTDRFATYIPKELAKKFCSASDVMIGRYGPPIFQILRGIEGAYNVALIKATPRKGVDRDYMYYFLSRDPLLRVIESHSQRTSGQTGIEMDVLKSYPMPLPPLPEQKRIAKTLATWDKAITTTEKLLANSQQQKKALMQQLLTGKKRLLNKDGVRFSGKWKTCSLGEIGEIKSAGVDKKINDDEKPVRLLNFTDVFKKSYIYSDEINHWVTAPNAKVDGCNVLKGDVFFTPSSETRDEVGMSAVIVEDIHDCCYSYHVVRFRIKENWSLDYKAFAFSTPSFRRQAALLADGSGQRYVISQDGFRSIIISYPEIAEQVAIGKVLRMAEEEIEALQQSLYALRKEKKALMQQLLTGRRRVSFQ